MTLKPGFDDEFQPKGQWCSRPVRVVGWLMIVAAVCGVALSVMAGTGKHKRNPRSSFPGALRPVQVPQVKALRAQPRDPFVIVAAAEIDAKMVVRAPALIDRAMVFNPYSRERQPANGAPASQGFVAPLPDDQPYQAPYDFNPHQSPWPARPK